MKSAFTRSLLLIAATAMSLTGCLFKPAAVSPRHFVLAPISKTESDTAPGKHISVGVGFVKMPSYLLRDSIAIRDSASEIRYLDNAQWGERLDQCLQRTVAANLSRELSSDSVYFADWGRDQVMVRVFINVQQFDVDTQGRGTLIAQWRLAPPNSDIPLKSGRAELERTGASPRGNPEVIATTLSELAAEFSGELAHSIRECSQIQPVAGK